MPGTHACTLYAFIAQEVVSWKDALQPSNDTNTYFKSGGCISNGTACIYRGLEAHDAGTTIPLSVCSANGASYAFAANAKLFYGHSGDADVISTAVNKSCSPDPIQFNALAMRAGGKLTALKTVDTELLWNRFRTFLSDSDPVGLELTGLRQVLGLSITQYASPPASSKPYTTAIGSTSLTITPNSGRYSFGLTQSYALPPHGVISCEAQAALASNLAGDLDTGLVPVCYSIGNCIQPSYSNTDLEDRVLRAYLLQLQVCQNAMGWQTDTEYPVPAVLYVQPAAGWTAYVYQGLPTYRLPGSAFGPTDPISPFIPAPLPTPAPPTPAPAPTPVPPLPPPPSNSTIITQFGCRFSVYTNWHVLRLNSPELLPLNASQYAVTANVVNGSTACAEKCANALLCRFFTTDPCTVWGFSNSELQNENYAVNTGLGCVIKNTFFVGRGTGKSFDPIATRGVGTLALKDSCCIILSP